MAKVLKVVAIAAGAVALIATAVGTFGIGTAAFSALALKVGAIAGVVATAASLGANLLTKPPPARGSETRIQVGVEPPSPYLMGEAYSGGILRHDVAYGPTLKEVPNPYRGMVMVYSVAGPLAALMALQADFEAIPSFYTGFLYTDTQLGSSPETSALTPNWSGMPGWGASSKLSGQAAILWNLKFDKDGKRFASGLPNLGAVWQGVKVYDPREDSTYPGGSGAQRIDDEATWEYSDNPALHAVAYAYGRYQNGKKVFGIGQPAEGIDLARFAAWANVCEANGWRISGTIYEPGDRWANLKDIMAAGGAEPVVTGGVLSVRYRAPQVALATITENDIADDDLTITAMQSYRERVNGIVPKFRSPDHNWEFVSAEKVSVPAYVTEDGEEKDEERQWNLVRDADQVAQLAAYALQDARELGPIEITLKPQWRWVKPGSCFTLDLPSLDFEGDAVLLQREIDPATMKVKCTFIGETEGKHDYALGLTGTPPPTPALGQTAQERDELAAAATGLTTAARTIVSKTVAFPVTSATGEIDIAAFDGVLNTGSTVSFPADTITGLADATLYGVFYDLAAGTYAAVAYPATASMADGGKVFLAWMNTPDSGGTYDPPPDSPPGYGGGGGYDPNYNLPN